MTIEKSEPGAATAAAGADDVHLVCCNPKRALCGTVITGAEDDGPVTCSPCDLIDEHGSPCGGRFCKVRQQLRLWFGWWPW